MPRYPRCQSLAALTSALLLCGVSAAAQSPAENAETLRAAQNNVRLLDPAFESPVRSAVPAFVLSAFRGEGEARAQAGFALGPLSAILAASAPFTGKASDEDTELATEAGLTGGTTLSLTISGLAWGPPRIRDAQASARKAWCEKQQEPTATRFTEDDINCAGISRSRVLELADPPPPLSQDEVTALVEEFKNLEVTDRVKWCGEMRSKQRIPHLFHCADVSEESLQALDDPRRVFPAGSVEMLVRDYDRAARLGWDIPVQYGLQAKISPQSFDFLDAATLAEGSESHLAYSIGGGVGVFVRPFTRIDADVSYERAFKGGRSTQVCTPLPPAGTSECGDATLGGPTQTDGWVAEAGVRHFLRVGGLDVALNPRVRFRNEDETYTARVPIYFLPDKSGTSLLGGVAPTWNSGTERFGIVLFVGSTFNLDAPIR